MISKKRGLSNVLATALLVLLTISAVVIVAGFIIPFVNDSLDSTSCFDYREYYEFDDSLGFNCYDSSTNVYILSVGANPGNKEGDEVQGFILRFKKEGSAITLNVSDGGPVVGAITMYDSSLGGGNFIIPSSGGTYSVLTYNYSSVESYEGIELYPFIEGEICDKSDSLRVYDC